jgi:hypothetical protein
VTYYELASKTPNERNTTMQKRYAVWSLIWIGFAALALVAQITDQFRSHAEGSIYVMSAIIMAKLQMIHSSIVGEED